MSGRQNAPYRDIDYDEALYRRCIAVANGQQTGFAASMSMFTPVCSTEELPQLRGGVFDTSPPVPASHGGATDPATGSVHLAARGGGVDGRSNLGNGHRLSYSTR